MTATLSPDDMRDAISIVLQVTARRNGNDLVGAYRMARTGQKLYPGLAIDGVDDVWGTVLSELLDSLGTAPVSAAPVSAAPVSAAPVSAAPVSAAPVSARPVSARPVSARPVSARPVSAAPVSAVPVSARPVSVAPVSAAPVSARPVSLGVITEQTVYDTRPGGPLDGGVSLGTIIVTHNAVLGTRVPSVKGDGTWPIFKGQRWNYTRAMRRGTDVLPGYYRLGNSKGFVADMERIGWLTHALRKGGFTVVHEIDDTGCTVKSVKTASQRRQESVMFDVRMHAKRQERVTPGMGSDEPVSAPPATVPVSAAPTAPVSVPVAAQVSAPRPPQPATPVITVPAYQPMGVEELLTAAIAGDLSALGEVRARLNRLAEIDAAAPRTSDSIPAEMWDAALAELTSPSVPAPAQQVEETLPPQVRVTGDTAEVWFDVNVTGKAMREAATALRVSLNRAITNRNGENGNRPEPRVYRSKAAKAFRVTITAHDGGDITVLAAKALQVAAGAVGVVGIREFIEVSAETVDA